MRLGDHAFAHYADDNVRWQVPAVFTQRGLGCGEKVIIMGDPAVSADEAYQRLAAFAGPAEQARTRGQLVFSSFPPAVVEEMRVSHPVALLERPGGLEAWYSAGEVHLIGDGDLLTRPQFRDAVRAALAAGA